MPDPVTMFMEGGAGMYVVLAFGVCGSGLVPLALIIAIVARLTNKLRMFALVFAVLGLLVAIVPMCAGAGGYFLGLQNMDAALESAPPEYRQMLEEVGEAEASNNLTFGFGTGCVLLVPAVLALLLVPAKPVVYDDY